MDLTLYSCLNVFIDLEDQVFFEFDVCVFNSFLYVCLGFYAFLAGRKGSRLISQFQSTRENICTIHPCTVYRKHKSKTLGAQILNFAVSAVLRVRCREGMRWTILT